MAPARPGGLPSLGGGNAAAAAQFNMAQMSETGNIQIGNENGAETMRTTKKKKKKKKKKKADISEIADDDFDNFEA